jgi:hypothetical protein
VLYWSGAGLVGIPSVAFRALRMLSARGDRIPRQGSVGVAGGVAGDVFRKRHQPLMRGSSLFITVVTGIFMYLVVLLAPPGFIANNLWWVAIVLGVGTLGLRGVNKATDRLVQKHKLSPKWAGAIRVAHCLGVCLLAAMCLAPLSDRLVKILQGSYVLLLVFIGAMLLIFRFMGLSDKTDDPDAKTHLWSAACALLAAFCLFSVVSFALVIYPFVPAERGGGDYFEMSNVRMFLYGCADVPPDIIDHCHCGENDQAQTIPLKLIKETASWAYVARPEGSQDPANWHPKIAAVALRLIKGIVVQESVVPPPPDMSLKERLGVILKLLRRLLIM